MREIKICDTTMRQNDRDHNLSLTFKEKIELSKLLDKLGVNVIELEGADNGKEDSLRIKSIASATKNATLAIPVGLTKESVDNVIEITKDLKNIRLQIIVPVSTARMEYLYHIKDKKLLEILPEIVKYSKEKNDDIEVIIQDITRGDKAFVKNIIETSIKCGASTITFEDSVGESLPDEFNEFVKSFYDEIEELKDVSVGISCVDKLCLADACVTSTIKSGISEIKTAAYSMNTSSLLNVSKILDSKTDDLDIKHSIRSVEANRIINQIKWLCEAGHTRIVSDDNIKEDDTNGAYLSKYDSKESLIKATLDIGYDLGEEDIENVWEAFSNIISQKEKISLKELDAIVATNAMQVVPTYKVKSFVINIGNNITAMAHISLEKKGTEEILEGVALGDGPIDAAFLALEQVVGTHFELDDFQIRSITQGRESMGEAVIRLFSDGKIYSGRGLSTDIVESSIRAYVNALNKIVCEEEL